MIHINWFHLQLLFLMSIIGISICQSYNDSCQDIGCGSKFVSSRSCQCNKECRENDDCCSDYDETCGSCQVIGCGTKYHKSRLCQCNKECDEYDNCCSDYKQTCESCQGIGCGSRYDRSRPCQCNKECRYFNNCCSDYNEICDSNVTVAVVVSVAGGVTVMVVTVVVVIYLKVRKERAQRLSKELENRHYYEIDSLNERTFAVIDPVGQRNDNWELNTADSISTTPNSRYSGGNVVKNVAYQSYDT